MPTTYSLAESTRMTRAVEHGKLDWATSVRIPVGLKHEIKTRFAAQVHDAPTAATFYLSLNNRRPPFNNLKARRAMSFALDRRTYVRVIGNDPALSTTTCQVLPPNFPDTGPTAHTPSTPRRPSGGRRRTSRGQSAWRLPPEPPARAYGCGSQSWGTALERYVASVVRALGWRPEALQLPDTTPAMADSRRNIELSQNTWTTDYPAPSAFFVPLFACTSFVAANPDENANETESLQPGHRPERRAR